MPGLILPFVVSCLSHTSSTPQQNKEEESFVSTSISFPPTETSTSQHPLPAWYQDAKLDIFIHWDLYAVPSRAKGTDMPTEAIEEYTEDIDAHWHELMERYAPWILRTDIGSPQAFSVKAVIADIYHKKKEGAANNRHTFQLSDDSPAHVIRLDKNGTTS
ncbi:alpha-L-fucosidase [Catalinimonas alkaloidigena]|uniref:alpha-L-fucosidase n=1 Tax=Catalinimonas alkaloidigena TaxID=1075417 RepID=UPI0024052597|nr:alpha-L-fucosidase [Catalinimonas alkaloidigena]